jgi:hypothetical protein
MDKPKALQTGRLCFRNCSELILRSYLAAISRIAARKLSIHDDENVIIIHADEAIYHVDTREIGTQRDKKVTMKRAR